MCAVIPVAGQRTHGTTFPALKKRAGFELALRQIASYRREVLNGCDAWRLVGFCNGGRPPYWIFTPGARFTKYLTTILR